MDGKRFGVGLLAGLLFAIAIVGASGVASSGGFLPLSHASQGPSTQAATTTQTSTTATSVSRGPAYAVRTTSQPPVPALGNQSDLTSLNAAVTSKNSTTTAGLMVFGSRQGPSGSPQFSSSLASMGQLSTQYRALLLAPIVAAFLIGALLYRFSHGRSEKAE
ncbi:MAG: hypothetical protein JRM80_00310 [Nitrososphaerota archaeon]|nr:hypothetical protein [Nitrososphaerota archaeon]